METSAPTATEKKECKGSGLDGSSFSEIPKKPSPTTLTRGTAIYPLCYTVDNMTHHSCRIMVSKVILQFGEKLAALHLCSFYMLVEYLECFCLTVGSCTQKCSELKHGYSHKSLGGT